MVVSTGPVPKLWASALATSSVTAPRRPGARCSISGRRGVPWHMAMAASAADAERHGHSTQIRIAGEPTVTVRVDALKRCLFNLVSNAQRYGDRIEIEATRDARFLTINVDDDGPGIAPEHREDVFRPFFRIDEARNQDEGGTGLGLAIARDIARSHGGDIMLGQSPMGGLRATVRLPV